MTFQALCLQLQRKKDLNMCKLRTDHGKEFESLHFSKFFQLKGIFHEFLAPMTLQQNGVVERKNRTLQEMVRVMLHAKSLPFYFWLEAVNTARYI